MSFLYPRTISISRPNSRPVVGQQPYGGVTKADETEIAPNVPARIQVDRQGTLPGAKLPGDAAGQSIWLILFILPLGTVKDRDLITDELGNRYQIISYEWGPLLTTARCQIMET
jgi:hypothetical protein